MHDGLTFTLQEAIQRHTVQAGFARRIYLALSAGEQAQPLAFLNSLQWCVRIGRADSYQVAARRALITWSS